MESIIGKNLKPSQNLLNAYCSKTRRGNENETLDYLKK